MHGCNTPPPTGLKLFSKFSNYINNCREMFSEHFPLTQDPTIKVSSWKGTWVKGHA